jgi:hypothetical protein
MNVNNFLIIYFFVISHLTPCIPLSTGGEREEKEEGS